MSALGFLFAVFWDCKQICIQVYGNTLVVYENVYKFTFCIHNVYKDVYMYTNLYTRCNDAMFTGLLLLFTKMYTTC